MQRLAKFERSVRALDRNLRTEQGDRPPGWLSRMPTVLGLIAAYLGTHLILRLHLSPTLGIDDAEQILFAQHWAFGYRFRQPPLFTWLLLPWVKMIGPGIVAVSIVRYGLLAITYVCLYLTALHWINDRRLAALSVLSFSSIYVFAYYAHHDLTHTTALGAMIAAAFLAFTRLSHQPTTMSYLVLGATFGLGMLSKWNFVMLATGLPITCLLFSTYRPLVLDKRSLLAIAVMIFIMSPTTLWMWSQGQTAGSVSNNILSNAVDIGLVATVTEGSIALLTSIFLFPLPFLLLFTMVFGASLVTQRARPQGAEDQDAKLRFLGGLILVVLMLHVLLIPLLGAVNFTERWMHPALQILPIFLFAWLARRPPGQRATSLYLCLLGLIVALSIGARLYRYVEGADQCGKCRELAPFVELAADLRAAGFDRGTILAADMHIGGNLKMAFPESRVIDPAFPLALWPAAKDHGESLGGMCLMVWRADQPDTARQRDMIIRFAQDQLGVGVTDQLLAGKAGIEQQRRVERTLYNSSNRLYALGFELIRENPGACR